jgi:hypothetical protein
MRPHTHAATVEAKERLGGNPGGLMQITKAQLGRLQTLFAQLVRHEIGMDGSREGRIAWATERCGRPISSFRDLTCSEASYMIDGIQGHLGVKAPVLPSTARRTARLDRDQARRAGLDGRADGKEFQGTPQMVRPEDMARIQRLLDELAKPPHSWNHQTFLNFLNSSRSPLAKRADKTIRTNADANKVWWALKRVANSKGIFQRRSA